MEPIISIKEARKLLGKNAEKLSDEDVSALIIQLSELARIALTTAQEKLNNTA